MTTVGDMMYHMGGVPVTSKFTTGSIFFVDSSTGSNSNAGTDKDSPVATVDYAIGLCTASKGDIIYVMPGHAETTTAIAWDVVGIEILGIGHGASRPKLTASTGASDLIDVTVASGHLDNIILAGAASGCTALIDLSSAADDFWLSNFRLESGAAPTAQMTIQPGANDGLIEHGLFIGTAAGLAKCIAFENSTDGTDNEDWIIRYCNFNAIESAGCDDACIEVKTSSGGVTGILIQDCNFLGLADGDAAINPQATSSGRCTGMAVRCSAHGADATDAFVESDLLGYIDCYSTQAGTKPFGATAGAGMFPALTAAA